LKDVGKVYVQVVIVDVFRFLAFVKLHNLMVPTTTCDLLNDRVLPFYDPLSVPVGEFLNGNRR